MILAGRVRVEGQVVAKAGALVPPEAEVTLAAPPRRYLSRGSEKLVAALDIPSGQVLTKCKPCQRHQEFLAFLNHIDAKVPPDLESTWQGTPSGDLVQYHPATGLRRGTLRSVKDLIAN